MGGSRYDRRTAILTAGMVVALGLGLLGRADVAGAEEVEAPVIGEAEEVVAPVRGIFGEITRELVVEDEVFAEEVVETGTEAATRLVFLDGTHLTMGPHSQVTLDRYVYDPATGTGDLIASIVSGVFEFAAGLIPDEGYDLRTPFADIGIRGTVLVCWIAADHSAQQCAVLEGVIALVGEDWEVTLSDADQCAVWREPGPPTVVPIDDCTELNVAHTTMLALLTPPDDVVPTPPTPTAPASARVIVIDIGDLREEALLRSTRILCELQERGVQTICPTPN